MLLDEVVATVVTVVATVVTVVAVAEVVAVARLLPIGQRHANQRPIDLSPSCPLFSPSLSTLSIEEDHCGRSFNRQMIIESTLCVRERPRERKEGMALLMIGERRERKREIKRRERRKEREKGREILFETTGIMAGDVT